MHQYEYEMKITKVKRGYKSYSDIRNARGRYIVRI